MDNALNYLRRRSNERAVSALEKSQEFLSDSKNVSQADLLIKELNLTGATKKESGEYVEKDTTNQYTALQRSLKKDIEDISSELGEELPSLESVSVSRLNNFLYGNFLKLKSIKKKLINLSADLINEIYQNGRQSDPAVWQNVQKYESAISSIDKKIDTLSQRTPESFLANGLLKFRRNKRLFEKYGVIETPEVEEAYHQISFDAKKKLGGRNGVVALLGGTGTGKTVLARRLASEMSSNTEEADNNYEFVSAHSKMTPDDLIDRLGIVPEYTDPLDVPDKIEELVREYRQSHPSVGEKELEKSIKEIKEVVLGQSQQKTMQTKKVLEAVGRAQERGVKVIIDEFNYLPAETLASLNDILANTNNKEGFGVIFTGNIGQEFDRKDLDPALVNRILENSFEIQTPPQDNKTAFSQAVLSREDYLAGSIPVSRDLYLSALTQLIDKKGNLIAPENATQMVWDLSQAFALIQKVSRGENPFSDDPNSQDIGDFVFKKIFLSFRNFNSILNSWKEDSYSQSLDYYIMDKIIRPSSIWAPKESAMLLYLFQKSGFLEGETSSGGIDLTTSPWNISGVPKVTKKEDYLTDFKIKAFTPQELVEAGYGIAMPSFEEMYISPEDLKDRGENSDKEKQLEEFGTQVEVLEKYLQDQMKLFSLLCDKKNKMSELK